MPNYATTTISVTGPHSLIEKIKDSLEGDKFNFNKLIPCPPEVENTSVHLAVFEDKEELDKYVAERMLKSDNTEENPTLAIMKDEYNRRITEYGAADWYEWRNLHWGVKWIGNLSYHETHGLTNIVLVFDTAWQEPVGVLDWITANGGKIVGGTSYELENEITIHGDEDEFNKYFIIKEEILIDDEDEDEEPYVDRWNEVGIRPDAEWDSFDDPELTF